MESRRVKIWYHDVLGWFCEDIRRTRNSTGAERGGAEIHWVVVSDSEC